MADDHPWFTALYRRIVRWEASGPIGDARRSLGETLHGHVLIVGLGPGEDLHYLGSDTTQVTALEPSPSMRESTEQAVASCTAGGVEVTVLDAPGERIPLQDNAVDSALLAFVLCTVADPEQVLSEVKRVVRPGGNVAVLEHVRAQPGTITAWLQRVVAPLWPHVAGGCHLDRDTRSAFVASGFNVDSLQDKSLVNVPLVSPSLLGVTQIP